MLGWGVNKERQVATGQRTSTETEKPGGCHHGPGQELVVVQVTLDQGGHRRSREGWPDLGHILKAELTRSAG